MACFHRVVAVGFLLPGHALSCLERGSKAADTKAFGRPARISARFESKPGGGGHVVFSREDRPDVPERLIIEPHPTGWYAAAFLTESDYRRTDEVFLEQIRVWLADLFQLKPIAENTPSVGRPAS